MEKIIKVALDVPIHKNFDYIYDKFNQVKIGSIVKVPFGKKIMSGIVVSFAHNSNIPKKKLKKIISVSNKKPISKETMNLAKFCSSYYLHPVGSVFKTILPLNLKKNDQSFSQFSIKYVVDKHNLENIKLTISNRQYGVLNLFRIIKINKQIYLHDARKVYSKAKTVLDKWNELGFVTKFHEEKKLEIAQKKNKNYINNEKITLTSKQRDILKKIKKKGKVFSVNLIHGITGSGKTEIYIELIKFHSSQGNACMMLVPEINLTPQFEEKLISRLPEVNISVLHSRVSEKNRIYIWESFREGNIDVIIGTRLAVFYHSPKLSLIIVDEEHDKSFKQSDGFKYNARDLAIYVSREKKIPVVLGSATPSLESIYNSKIGKYDYYTINERFNSKLPAIKILEMSKEKRTMLLSGDIIKAIRNKISKKEQVLIFINKRGFSKTLFCRDCSWTAVCNRCSAKLTFHKSLAVLKCHYCSSVKPMIEECPNCKKKNLYNLGVGSEKVEEEIKRIFHENKILRIDSDTTKHKGSFEKYRNLIIKGNVDIIIGTQMLSKGHHFPKISLVCILESDQSLFSSDFRATETLYQQLVQVSGRAGRGKEIGEVILQTEFPNHPLYLSFKNQKFDTIVDMLLDERKVTDFPPYRYQALLKAESSKKNLVFNFLDKAKYLSKSLNFKGEVYDPIPPPVEKISGRYRGQILIQSSDRKNIRNFLKCWNNKIIDMNDLKIKWTFDVDPIEV